MNTEANPSSLFDIIILLAVGIYFVDETWHINMSLEALITHSMAISRFMYL